MLFKKLYCGADLLNLPSDFLNLFGNPELMKHMGRVGIPGLASRGWHPRVDIPGLAPGMGIPGMGISSCLVCITEQGSFDTHQDWHHFDISIAWLRSDV